MVPVSIFERPVVSGGVLKDSHVTLMHTKIVGGKTFFPVSKSDRDIERLMLGRVHQKQRVMQAALVFDRMLQQRNAAVDAATNRESEVDDLGVDEKPKKKSRSLRHGDEAEQKIVAIQVEGIVGEWTTMNVLASANKHLNLYI